jgi:hypothetical protein
MRRHTGREPEMTRSETAQNWAQSMHSYASTLDIFTAFYRFTHSTPAKPLPRMLNSGEFFFITRPRQAHPTDSTLNRKCPRSAPFDTGTLRRIYEPAFFEHINTKGRTHEQGI